MAKQATEPRKLPKGWSPPRFYLDGEPVDRIPEEAKTGMADRLSRAVSQHFREHPEELEPFMRGLEDLRKRKALT